MNAHVKRLEKVQKQATRSIITTLTGLTLLGAITTQAADVNEFGVLKGRVYTQVAEGTPADDFSSYYWWSAYVRLSAVGTVTLAHADVPDFGSPIPLTQLQDPKRLEFKTIGGLTIENFNITFPSGNYIVSMNTVNDGNQNVTLSLSGDAYPNTPAFLNFSALESVNSEEPLTLNWPAFTEGTANDLIQLQIMDGDNNDVFITPAFGAAGALSGTATSVTVPAETLSPGNSFAITLTFTKVVSVDTSSYVGATGLTGYYKSTTTSLETTAGSGGGGDDTMPPELSYSTPLSGSSEVDVDSPIRFVFDEAMTNSQSITWSSNVNPANFTYSWSNDGHTLTCNYAESFPAMAYITWTLNPSGQPLNFKDVAGNPLPEDSYFGGFFTTSSTNDPCNAYDDSRGSGGIIKELIYIQSSASNPVPDPAYPASFFSVVASPTNNPVTSAMLQVPSGPLLTITNLTGFGRAFMINEIYASQSALDAARPNATYTLQLTRTTGTPPSASISLDGTYPPTPHIQNYTACQAIDAASDFTVQWNGFSGANTGDYVSFSIFDPATSWNWSAPDPCIPRELPNTATSITLPADTLQPGITYEASLIYSRMTHSESNGIPDIDLVAYLHKTVNFTITTTGGNGGTGAQFIGWRLLPSGKLEIELQGTIGLTYAIESTDDLLSDWSIVSAQTVPAGGVVTFEISPDNQQAFFRIKSM